MEDQFKRNCPRCDKQLTYKSYSGWHCAKSNKKICGSCAQKERCSKPEEFDRRSKLYSQLYLGENNPFFGKSHNAETIQHLKETGSHSQKLKTEHKSLLEYWTDNYGPEEAERKWADFRSNISKRFTGTGNPMFGKPAPHGSGNGWSGWYKGWFFRSLLELSYRVKMIDAFGHQWRTAETKDLCIQYIDWSGRQRNYFADFLVDETSLIECKPQKLHGSKTVQLKKDAAIEFCESKGYNYILTDCDLLSDSEVADLRTGGLLVFTERYELKFMERTRYVK